MPTESLPPGSHVLIAGLGLIGGSIALAIRRKNVRVTALVRDRDRYSDAINAGVVDAVVSNASEASDVTHGVVCTPVNVVVETLVGIQRAHPHAFLTDAGSTKVTIAADAATRLPHPERFVPAHPLAGSERTGWQAAHADLFHGRTCVLIADGPSKDALETIRRLWKSCGFATLHETTARQHDDDLAQTSHLPHLVAAALVNAVTAPPSMRATGYADTTRIAAGDPQLWTAIVRENPDPIRQALATMGRELRHIETAIASGDYTVVAEWLTRAAQARRRLTQNVAES